MEKRAHPDEKKPLVCNAIPGTDEANIYDVTIVWDGDVIVETSVILTGECHVNAERSYGVRVKYDKNEKQVLQLAVQHSERYYFP
eukprot:3939154-Rhodomonas_salina.1